MWSYWADLFLFVITLLSSSAITLLAAPAPTPHDGINTVFWVHPFLSTGHSGRRAAGAGYRPDLCHGLWGCCVGEYVTGVDMEKGLSSTPTC